MASSLMGVGGRPRRACAADPRGNSLEVNAPADKPKGWRDHRVHELRDGFPGLMDLMHRLLDPDTGCPWDQAQTLDSLRPYVLEEAHELLESMHDPQEHRRELGDLLFQVVFHTALREREGHFDADGVIEAIRSKMLRRHPHVFMDAEARARRDREGPPSAEALARQWTEIKAQERAELRDDDAPVETGGQPLDPLAGVPRSLSAMQRAWRIQDKASSVGFDWPSARDVLAKIREELDEVEEAMALDDPRRDAAVREEFGDLLFALARLGQKLHVDPEDALRRATHKFEGRFAHVMRRCHEDGVDPLQAGLSRLEDYWQEAKAVRDTDE